MRKAIFVILLLLCTLSLPHKAQAQGGFYRDISLQWNGVNLIPNAGAQIAICAAGSLGTPCSPTITIYSNAALSVTQTNPITTGTDGSWSLYLTPGQYVYTATGTGLNPQGPFLFTVTSPAQISASGTAGNVVQYTASSSVGDSGIPANTVVTLAGINTLTNKTLAAPTITSPTVTNPATTGTDSGAETLQNKTLVGALGGNKVTLSPDCPFQGPQSPITGTGAAAIYYTCTLSANAFASGKGLRIISVVNHSTGSVAQTYKLSFGGTILSGIGAVGATNGTVVTTEYDVFNNGSTSAQAVKSIADDGNGGQQYGNYGTAAVNTTSSVVINLTFNVAATDAITPEMFRVELIQ